MLHVPEQISKPRLTLRRIRHGDAMEIFQSYSSDPQVARYMTFPVATSVHEPEQFVERAVQSWNDGNAFTFVILSPTHSIIGGCGIVRVTDWHFTCGYCLARSEWGKGFATEVAQAFRGWFDATPSVFRLSAFVDVDNHASCRVLEKAGFQFEGILRRLTIHPNISTHPRDAKIYAVVKE